MDQNGNNQSAQIHIFSGLPIVKYSCIQGWTGSLGGIGNIGDDPLFQDEANLDFRLRPLSPCIDAGDNSAVRIHTDLGGLPRALDYTVIPDSGIGTPPIVDMGAFEYHGDCNGNGIDDGLDIAGATSDDCNLNGIPDECEADEDCNSNTIADICDIAGGSSVDCDGNFRPDECDPDCNGNNIADACDVANGSSDDCDLNGIPDECEPDEDCNGNTIRDTCEIGRGISPDCNGNQVPDGCDVATGASPDANSDGVPDECLGACCVCSECLDTTAAECAAQGGSFTALGVICNVVQCSGVEDDCLDMEVLPSVADQSVAIDNRCASDDGPTPVNCDNGSQPFGADVWYGFMSPCDGSMTVSMCDGTDYDAIIAIYDGGVTCACPSDDSTQVVCGDDTCGVGGGPATVTIDILSETCYVIRVAGWNGTRGVGEMNVSVACLPPIEPPQPEPNPIAKNRYISFLPNNPGRQTALRVIFVDLPPPFDVRNGTHRWVGQPSAVSENGGSVSPVAGFPDFNASALQCQPLYADWSAFGIVHAYGREIVPGGLYDIQVINANCDVADESCYTAALNLSTSVWGDVGGAFVDGAWSAPDGRVDVITDVVAILNKFSNQPTAPIKARADLEPDIVDGLINITDVLRAVHAFSGLRYPFEPGPLPCP